MLTNIIIGIVGFIIGWKLREVHAKWYLARLEKKIKEEIDRSGWKQIKVKVHKENDMFYLYEVESEKFVTQGKSRKEISEYLAKYFPETSFVADPENVKEVGFVDDN